MTDYLYLDKVVLHFMGDLATDFWSRFCWNQNLFLPVVRAITVSFCK